MGTCRSSGICAIEPIGGAAGGNGDDDDVLISLRLRHFLLHIAQQHMTSKTRNNMSIIETGLKNVF